MKNQIFTLLRKEFKLEMRNNVAFWGVLLYIVSTIYLIYFLLQSQNGIDDLPKKIWISLYWIVILFASVNAIAKSFAQESKSTQLYLYSIVNPQALIVSKMIYNFLMVLLLTFISYLVFVIFLGNPIQNTALFVFSNIAGATAYSFLFTMITGIASKADNNNTLAAILGFPIVIPLIIYVSKVSRESFLAEPSENCWINFLILIGFNIVLFMLSIILYPYIWRE